VNQQIHTGKIVSPTCFGRFYDQHQGVIRIILIKYNQLTKIKQLHVTGIVSSAPCVSNISDYVSLKTAKFTLLLKTNKCECIYVVC